jgi:hypothetical protein
MRTIPDQLKSRNLVPFKKRNGRYNIPGLASEHEVLMDADLSPEEQGFIRHYLGYADAFLRSVEHIVPEPREEPVAQNEREEVTEQPAQAKGNPNGKAA